MGTILEFLGITLVVAVVTSATQADAPREIARRSVRFFFAASIAVVVLAGIVALVSGG